MMKHVFAILLLALALPEKVLSDAGNCVKYEVEVQLNDEQKIRGFVYVGGYETKFQFKDVSFLAYLKRVDSRDTVHLFKNIRQLKYPADEAMRSGCEFRFDATSADNDIKILKNKIKSITVVRYMTCNACDSADEKTGYYWNGIYPTVITELTKAEIDLLQTKPIATISFGHDEENNTDGYTMLSYSPAHKQKDLEKLRDDFLTETNLLLREHKWNVVQDKYNVLKGTLRKKKIVIFKVTSEI